MEDFNSRWLVIEHTIPASHVRGFARGIIDEEKHRLRLSVKQYVPRTTRDPAPGDPTIIFAHGVGSSKESYEPFLDGLLLQQQQQPQQQKQEQQEQPAHDASLSQPLRLRAVWIPDIAWHGASYQLNRAIIGDEPHWEDSARDVVHMINHFQAEMPPPLLGIAQSWGAFTLLHAALYHPRLFAAGLALLEPTLLLRYPEPRGGPGHDDRKAFAYGMIFKKDTWPTRDEARAYLLRNPYYGAFDPAVFERVVRYDLRDVEGVDDNDSKPAVTLTTPKAMEAYTMMRPWPPLPGMPDNPDHQLLKLWKEGKHEPRQPIAGFHRQELERLFRNLPDLLPPVLIVWAEKGLGRFTGYREHLIKTIGTGKEGSGGAAEGKVTERWVEKSGHPLPLEYPQEAAAAIAPWLVAQMTEWRERADRIRQGPAHFTAQVNPAWIEKASKL